MAGIKRIMTAVEDELITLEEAVKRLVERDLAEDRVRSFDPVEVNELGAVLAPDVQNAHIAVSRLRIMSQEDSTLLHRRLRTFAMESYRVHRLTAIEDQAWAGRWDRRRQINKRWIRHLAGVEEVQSDG